MKSTSPKLTEPALSLIESEIVAGLLRTIEQLEMRIAELERPPPRWMPLKAAAGECGLAYEWVRKHAVRGEFEAERRGGRWYVNATSLRQRFSHRR